KAGRYGGTYAYSDIAMSFATWISPKFQLYIMKDYRRLKTDENSRLSLLLTSYMPI
ncbi:MAG: KilA-N domain-containing protein, partial [Lachnospiraceae bacterium]|nr:KilA-N domain-containing protein [Lachnospiraceae bacterium]